MKYMGCFHVDKRKMGIYQLTEAESFGANRILINIKNNNKLKEMEEKSIKITIPKGYEIDKENSTFAEIKFKPIEEKYPKSWEEAFEHKKLHGFYVCDYSDIESYNSCGCTINEKNVFKTKAQAKSALAYAQLTQLMALPCYNGDGEPDWSDGKLKYVIERNGNELCKSFCNSIYHPICFKTGDTMDAFFTNHRDLLEIYFQIKKQNAE